jgi:hypothetical protein
LPPAGLGLAALVVFVLALALSVVFFGMRIS